MRASQNKMDNVLGVILAGGLSRRMSGEEKSLMKIGQRTSIEWVKDRLTDQLNDVIINANGDISRFETLGLPVISDTVEGFVGPLAGVLAAMRWAASKATHSHIITVAADTPFFPTDYVSQMLKPDTDIVLAGSDSRRHPVFGLWPISLADKLEEFLVIERERKVMLFVERYGNAIVNFPLTENGIDPFFNVNTPDDMKVAEKIAVSMA